LPATLFPGVTEVTDHPDFEGEMPCPPIIRTVSNRRVHLLEPDSNQIVIEDIAHALAKLCRWSGQVEQSYSVAEHCVRASRMVPSDDPEAGLAALLHDATEAYMADIPRPLKCLLPEYVRIENHLAEVIFTRFGLTYPYSPAIKEIDNRLGFNENHQLREMADMTTWHVWTFAVARSKFLARFHELEQKRQRLYATSL
jgi:hypothetical protein